MLAHREQAGLIISELAEAYRGTNVGHIDFEAHKQDIVFPAAAITFGEGIFGLAVKSL